MRVAIASGNTIINVIEASDIEVAAEVYPDAELLAVGESEIGIGWVREGEDWVVPPAPDPKPKSLTHLQFIEHAQAAGEMTDEALVAAKLDSNLAAFWIKFELVTSLEKDHPTTVQGLSALVLTGHLTEAGREAIVELWPTR